jgi:hypothetical protein
MGSSEVTSHLRLKNNNVVKTSFVAIGAEACGDSQLRETGCEQSITADQSKFNHLVAAPRQFLKQCLSLPSIVEPHLQAS